MYSSWSLEGWQSCIVQLVHTPTPPEPHGGRDFRVLPSPILEIPAQLDGHAGFDQAHAPFVVRRRVIDTPTLRQHAEFIRKKGRGEEVSGSPVWQEGGGRGVALRPRGRRIAGDVLYDISVGVQQVSEHHWEVVTADVVHLFATWRHVGKVVLVLARVDSKTFEEKGKELLICLKLNTPLFGYTPHCISSI